jgi:hypothetical protein
MRSVAFVVTLLMLTVVSAGMATAEAPSSPEDRAKAIAPYLDRQTIGVGYVDVRRVEPKALVDLFVRLLPEGSVDQEQTLAGISSAISTLRQYEIPEFYVVVSLADLPDKPPLILPTGERSNVEGLVKAAPWQSRYYVRVEKLNRAVIIGSQRALDRFKRQPPEPRPELVEAFRAAGDAAVQLLVLPSKDDRRVVEEMLPQLPPEIGGGPSTILTRGLRWMAVGINLPPATSLHVVIQSQDAAAAAALREKWIAATRLLGRKELPQVVQNLERPASLLIPEVQGDRLVVSSEKQPGGIEPLLQAFAPSLEEARRRLGKRHSANRLKQIALALHNYYDQNQSFPAQAKFDAQGKPLLSWRVLILPMLDQNKLYQQFHLNEPWDSPHNRTLIEKMPDIFRSPVSKLTEKGRTNYLYPVGKETVCPGPRGVEFKEITDGTSNTIMVVEANDDQAVIWTKPDDLPFDPQQPAKGLGGLYGDGFWVAFCDGSVRHISTTIVPATLRALFTRAGGEAVYY